MMKHRWIKDEHKLDKLNAELEERKQNIETCKLGISNAEKALAAHKMSDEDYQLFKELNEDRIKNSKWKIHSVTIKIFLMKIKIKLLYGKYKKEEVM